MHPGAPDEMSNPVNDDACFAAARPRQNKQWPRDVKNGLSLLGVETVEQICDRRFQGIGRNG